MTIEFEGQFYADEASLRRNLVRQRDSARAMVKQGEGLEAVRGLIEAMRARPGSELTVSCLGGNGYHAGFWSFSIDNAPEIDEGERADTPEAALAALAEQVRA